LRASWHGLRDMIGIQRARIGAAQLEKHVAGANALARELGKPVEIELDISSVDATAEVLAAVNTAVVHLLRNAIDHGIEAPAERQCVGKPARGAIRIRGRIEGERFVLRIEDDGQGVALDRVHARAVELGLASADADIRARWFELVCKPGFSTRSSASDVSGRGVGLDAVHATISELGGSFSATTEPGRGTCWTLALPFVRATVDGLMFRVPGLAFPIVVDASWTVEQTCAPTLDLAHELGFASVCHAPRYTVRSTAGAIGADQKPSHATARRVVVTAPPARGEVVIADGCEALLLHRS
jgi:two-component system chemotaxis sensor kinase CheA